MKLLTALILLLSLVLPAGRIPQAMAAPVQTICSMPEDSGHACCKATARHCCCNTSPDEPAPPAQPLAPSASTGAKEIAAPLPALFLLTQLPRLSDFPDPSSPFSRQAAFLAEPPVRLCVLRCSLLL